MARQALHALEVYEQRWSALLHEWPSLAHYDALAKLVIAHADLARYLWNRDIASARFRFLKVTNTPFVNLKFTALDARKVHPMRPGSPHEAQANHP